MIIALLVSLLSAFPALQDVRYCGAPPRDASGQIIRRADVIRAYRQEVPCPSTGLKTGACPGWALNHTWPLICGGCDSVSNLAWMPNVLKSGAGDLPTDRWEQKVYCPDQRRLVPMPDRGRLVIQ